MGVLSQHAGTRSMTTAVDLSAYPETFLHVRKPGGLLLPLVMLCGLLSEPLHVVAQSRAEGAPAVPESQIFDDFEGYEAGSVPTRWQWMTSKTRAPLTADLMTARRSFLVQEEDGNRFVRVTVDNSWHRIVFTNDPPTNWSLEEQPCLEWDWRAVHLPAGAREDKANDTGAAVYVFFGRDWLGRPRSIKYSYSSALPVGTELSFGPLKLVVVSSGVEGNDGWIRVRRNVAEDYRRLFDKRSVARPDLIALWSDSDTTKDRAVADFDNIGTHACR